MSELHRPQMTVMQEDRRTERAIVGLLLDRTAPQPWSAAELVLEIGGEPPITLDSIDRLQRAGIVHRCGDFVFATRAARELDQVLA